MGIDGTVFDIPDTEANALSIWLSTELVRERKQLSPK